MSERRLRVAHVIVQPVLVWDDGEELSPGPEFGVIQVPLAQLAGIREPLLERVQTLANDDGKAQS